MEILQEINYEQALKEKLDKLTQVSSCQIMKNSEFSGIPAVSVIVPVYNVEAYLEECLRSLQQQTLANIEIICVNDGSTDQSLELMRRIAQGDSRFVICTQENCGLSGARNRGMSLAKGEYVYFCDSDDYILPETLEVLYNKAQQQNLDAVYFGVEAFGEDTEKKELVLQYQNSYQMQHDYPGIYTGLELFRLRKKNSEYTVMVYQAIYRKAFLLEKSISFLQGIIHEDNLYSFQVALEAQRVGYINEKYYRRRLRPNSIVTSLTKDNQQGIIYEVYCLFLVVMRLQELVALRQLEPIYDEAVLSEIGKSTTVAHKAYIRLTAEARAAYNILPLQEKIHFQSLIVKPAVFLEQRERLKTRLEGIKEDVRSKRKIWKEKNSALQKRIDELTTDVYSCKEKRLGMMVNTDASPTLTEEEQQYVDKFKARMEEWKEDREFKILKRNSLAKPPLVSAILPLYKVGNYLEQCVNSIRKQTMQDLEIICVNDGSPDNSLEVALKLAEEDDRITVCTQKNSGSSIGRNNGLKLATGKYVYFCDSDDYLLPETFEEVCAKAETENLQVVYFDIVPFSDEADPCDKAYNGYVEYYKRNHDYPGVYTGPQLFTAMKANNEYLMSPVIQVINREFLLGLNVWFVDYVIHQDNAFTFEVMLSASRVGYIHKEFYQRRVHTGSVMTSAKTFFDPYSLMKLVLHMYRFLEQLELPADAAEAAYEQMHYTFNIARNRYRRLSSAEKKTKYALPPRERWEFEMLIGDCADMQLKVTKADKKLKNIKNGSSFKIGRVITYVPRKILGKK